MSVCGDPAWANYKVSAPIRIDATSGGDGGLIFRVVDLGMGNPRPNDAGNMYYAGVLDGAVKLGLMHNNAWSMSLPAPEPANGALGVFRNQGRSGFAAAGSYPSGPSFGKLVTGDFDGDGHLDIAQLPASSGWQLSLRYGTGG